MSLLGLLRPAGDGLPAPPGAAFGGPVGQVGTVGGGAAVAHHLTGAQVASSHGAILRKDFRAIAEAVREVTTLDRTGR
nr:hypothetical protein [Micromonospora sp. KC606]